MSPIRIQSPYVGEVTVIANRFIDEYMPLANGEFVKVYLYLLRSLNSGSDFLLSGAADTLCCTESDIIRALLYWEKVGILSLSFRDASRSVLQGISLFPLTPTVTMTNVISEPKLDLPEPISAAPIAEVVSPESGTASSIPEVISPEVPVSNAPVTQTPTVEPLATVTEPLTPEVPSTALENASPSEVPSVPSEASPLDNTPPIPSSPPANFKLSMSKIKSLKSNVEVSQLLFIAERYLGKTLTVTETGQLLYFYDELHFSIDLIEYLIEYCVSKGTKSMRYIETVALAWHKAGISSVPMAKDHTSLYHKQYYDIMRAMGIRRRDPIDAEIKFMDTWLKEYKFSMELIQEACSRTISLIGQPSFQYTDGILNRWAQYHVKTIADVLLLDDEHKKTTQRNTPVKPQGASVRKTRPNTFTDFPQRTYDISSLEAQLLNQ